MPTVPISRDTAKYLVCRTLSDAGFDDVAIGRAMQALEATGEPEYTPEPEPESYEPSEADYTEYELWLERLEMERGCDAWTIVPVR